MRKANRIRDSSGGILNFIYHLSDVELEVELSLEFEEE